MRKIFGPVQDDDLNRVRVKHELDHLKQGPDKVRLVKTESLRWLGHVCKTEEYRVPRKMLEIKRVRKKGKRKTKYS